MKINLKRVIIYLVVLIVASAGSVGAYASYMKNKDVVKKELYAIEESKTFALKQGNVLKLNLTIEYAGKKGEATLTEKQSKLNDVLVTYFTNRDPKELEDKEKVKKELIKEFNTVLEEDLVCGILFNEFFIAKV